jgi:hypothetical protein
MPDVVSCLDDLVRIYEGSDGKATIALYQQLSVLGPAGIVAVNLFRAQKCSARAISAEVWAQPCEGKEPA